MPPLFLYPSKRDSSCSPCLHDVGLSSHALRTNPFLLCPTTLFFPPSLSLPLTFIRSPKLFPSLRNENTTHRKLGRGMGQRDMAFLQNSQPKKYSLGESSSLTCVQKDGKEGKQKACLEDVIYIFVYICISPPFPSLHFCFFLLPVFLFSLLSVQIHTQIHLDEQTLLSLVVFLYYSFHCILLGRIFFCTLISHDTMAS